MIRTWVTVISIVVLIISALLFLKSTYNKAHEAGRNAERVMVLEEKNKELGQALEAQQKNLEEATKFDEENDLRKLENDNSLLRDDTTVIVRPNPAGLDDAELDEKFLQELSKLR